jgi:hypothetical protein
MRRRLGLSLLLSFLVVTGVLVVAWALVTQPLLPRALKGTTVNIDPARLEVHVRMLSDTLVPRDESHPHMLDRAAAYIHRELEQAGGTVSEQPYDLDGKTYRNVIALFGPDTAERIVVGAHYDSVAADVPAADDNASGVAGLIELAYWLGATSPRMQIELVAYTLEEGQPNSQRYPHPLMKLFYPTQGNFIAVVGKLNQPMVVRRVKAAMQAASLLPVYSINAPRSVPGIDFSDHRNYWGVGYDAVMITDTAFYRNPNYHTPRDTAETLDYQRMAGVVQGVYAAVLALAQ